MDKRLTLGWYLPLRIILGAIFSISILFIYEAWKHYDIGFLLYAFFGYILIFAIFTYLLSSAWWFLKFLKRKIAPNNDAKITESSFFYFLMTIVKFIFKTIVWVFKTIVGIFFHLARSNTLEKSMDYFGETMRTKNTSSGGGNVRKCPVCGQTLGILPDYPPFCSKECRSAWYARR